MYISMIALFAIVIIFLCLGFIEPSNVIWWGEYEKKTRKKVLIYYGTGAIALLLILILTNGMASNAVKEEAEIKKVVQEQKKSESLVYKPTTEETQMLKKKYEELQGKDYTAFSDLSKKYDSMSEVEKKNVKTDMERLRKEKDVYIQECERQSEQNKQLYTDFSNEIESNYPDMKISDISGKDDKKTLYINMNLLYNITATETKCAELAVMKETRMKEIGINKIIISVNDKNEKNHGIIACELSQGKYKPTISTLE